jgi:beta-ribofuranosylaminobenzene 5'-phosphate synthase
VSREARIHVRACARLHLGFLDLTGSPGRQFGSVGLSLDEIALELTATPAATVTVSGPGAERAAAVARATFSALGFPGGVAVHIARAIPEHAGLGSGTQMALAIGTACARIAGAGDLAVEEIATFLLRGQRSGIGIGTFAQGGFVVDGGRGPGTRTPPIVSRLAVPEAWRFVLVLDRSRQGTHGDRETTAFDQLPAMPPAQSGQLCRTTLMQMLPALAEADCAAFGSAVSDIQAVIGEFFSRYQAGRFTSPDVATAVEELLRHGAAGGGQSSWGPTGFGIFPTAADAARAIERTRARWHDNAQLDFVSCRAANRPAAIRADAAARHAHG